MNVSDVSYTSEIVDVFDFLIVIPWSNWHPCLILLKMQYISRRRWDIPVKSWKKGNSFIVMTIFCDLIFVQHPPYVILLFITWKNSALDFGRGAGAKYDATLINILYMKLPRSGVWGGKKYPITHMRRPATVCYLSRKIFFVTQLNLT